MGDVVAGVVQEIKCGDRFVAEKGGGFSMRACRRRDLPFLPTARADLESLFWTLGFRGRPAVILAGVLEELIDTSSVGGSVFDIGSATYSITRILTGQLDAYVDIGPAIIAAHPCTEADFRRVGRGNVLCNSPYDLAAVHLICREAGVPIGDADGRPLDDRLVLGSDASFQLACIASGNPELQGLLVESSGAASRGSRRTGRSRSHGGTRASRGDPLRTPRRRRGAVPRLSPALPHHAWQERRLPRPGQPRRALYLLIYGRVCSVAADPIEKKPLYHFFPGTTVLSLGSVGCNFSCRHCQNWQIAHADATTPARDLRELPVRNLPVLAQHNDCQGVAWTYNEPTIWLEYILDGAQVAHEHGLYTVMVTNGYITDEALEVVAPHIDAYRVDVKGFSSAAYYELCRIKDYDPS